MPSPDALIPDLSPALPSSSEETKVRGKRRLLQEIGVFAERQLVRLYGSFYFPFRVSRR